jgi:hypothetical protein
MQKREPIEHLREFVDLRRRLREAWREANGGVEVPDRQLNANPSLPKVAGASWHPRVHGMGVLFSEVDGTRTIDIPDLGAPEEDVNAWDLARYMGSLGRTGEKVLHLALGPVGGAVDHRVELWLSNLAREGVLVSSGRGYRFS